VRLDTTIRSLVILLRIGRSDFPKVARGYTCQTPNVKGKAASAAGRLTGFPAFGEWEFVAFSHGALMADPYLPAIFVAKFSPVSPFPVI
jgi:hypothetical protein